MDGMRRLLMAVPALVLLATLAACSDGDSDGDSAAATSTTAAATSTTTTATTIAGGGDTSSSTSGPTDSTEASTTTTTGEEGPLAGERVEIFPYADAQLAVVGVAADDTLNVRAGPGTSASIVYELAPLETGITATGHNRTLEGSGFWAEITHDGRTGWANAAFLLQLGAVDDVTSRLFPTPDDRPSAETVLELGQAVAALRASEEPRSKIVVVDGPSVGDLGEITVDVIGLGDDAVGGERLTIFAEPDPGGESFTVRSVELTTLCTRGVSDGLCV